MVQSASRTKRSIEEFLKTERLGYQKIPLPFGLSTPGPDRSSTRDRIFTEHLDLNVAGIFQVLLDINLGVVEGVLRLRPRVAVG